MQNRAAVLPAERNAGKRETRRMSSKRAGATVREGEGDRTLVLETRATLLVVVPAESGVAVTRILAAHRVSSSEGMVVGATRWRPYEGRNIVGYYEFAIFRGGRIETGIVNYSVIIAGRIEVASKLQKSKLLLRSCLAPSIPSEGLAV